MDCSFGRIQTLTRHDVNIRKPDVGATLAVALGATPDNVPGKIQNVYKDPANSTGAAPGNVFAKIPSIYKGPANANGDVKTIEAGSKRAGARPAPTFRPGFRAI